VVLPMARLILEDDPLTQVQYFRGDMLLFLARCVAGLAFDETMHVPTRFETPPEQLNWAIPLVEEAEKSFWVEFSRAADGRKEADFVTAREALKHGTHSQVECWYSRFEDLMNTLAEARAWLEPPYVIKRAIVNALYVAPKSGRLQIIAPEDFDEMAGRIHHSFERLTVFEIIRRKSDTGMNVTLVSRAPSSIEDWRGRRADSARDAVQMAEDIYGLPEVAWYDCDADESSPANHFDLD
jgi:hypothetical protein